MRLRDTIGKIRKDPGNPRESEDEFKKVLSDGMFIIISIYNLGFFFNVGRTGPKCFFLLHMAIGKELTGQK